MPTQQSSFWCPQCEGQVLGTRQGCNHLLHAIITLFLCGLWIPIWILAAIPEPYRCQTCGGKVRSHFATGFRYGAALAMFAVLIVILVKVWTRQ